MADSVLRDKSKAFAKEIVFLCRRLKQSGTESALVNQLLRSGTFVGANVHEAQYAQGTKDFISKFEIALKECNESEYWLELLFETNTLKEAEFKDWAVSQMADGWGESFEQREIRIPDGEIYVSFWNSSDDYFMLNSDEFDEYLSQDLEMGGIQ